MKGSRRQFLKGSGAVAAGFVGLERFLLTAAQAKPSQKYSSEVAKYGKLIPDRRGSSIYLRAFLTKLSLLRVTRCRMACALLCPDGMAAFAGENGRWSW